MCLLRPRVRLSVMDQFRHVLEAVAAFLTTAKATFLGFGFALSGWITQENIIFLLTALVMLCQLISWGYKFVKWCRRPKAVE